MAAALLPQLRMRPGSRSCDLDGMAWHRPAVPVSHHDRARAARGQYSASPYPSRSRSSKAMHSLAAWQFGRPIKWNVFLPVSMPIVLTATAFVFCDMAACSSCFEALPDRDEHGRSIPFSIAVTTRASLQYGCSVGCENTRPF